VQVSRAAGDMIMRAASALGMTGVVVRLLGVQQVQHLC
jgi:hypothetical protein